MSTEIKSTEIKKERTKPKKFFTNSAGNSLLAKFNGIFDDAPEIKIFHCVSGYFRASGYQHLREKLLKLSEVKILVGIDVDKISHHYLKKNQLAFSLTQDLNNESQKIIREDVDACDYSPKTEQSIIDYWHDLRDKKIEIKIHKSKKLHSKIYIFLPLNHNENSCGNVITGSSNFTGSGIGANEYHTNYEFNVDLRDYEDVAFAEEEFQELWANSDELSPETIEKAIAQTYLKDNGKGIEPYHLFLKFLYEYFQERIDYDEDSIGDLPADFLKLKYQVDAVNEAYKMLMDFDGCFLADVVGLGKTVVATLIANKLAIENGKKKTRILVVYPPALEQNWKETFRDFHLDKITDFVSNGSLHKILNQDDPDYRAKEDYSIIIVDESHKFRNDKTDMYEELQKITKSSIKNCGEIITRKKVMLLSATPVNNRPADLLNQILLFTDKYHSSLPVKNLGNYFAPKMAAYKELMKSEETPEQAAALEKMMAEIRREIIQPIMVRRVRQDLENREMYATDLQEQGINFPKIAAPTTFEYQMDDELAILFNETANVICEKLTYMRYQMIATLKPEVLTEKYPEMDTNLAIRNLSKLMKTRMIKSLESSFAAFKSTLGRLQRSTTEMLKMIDSGKVYFVPNGKLQDWLDDELSYEEIEDLIEEKNQKNAGGYNTFEVARDFDGKDLAQAKTKLQADEAILTALLNQWQKIDRDPKLEKFLAELPDIMSQHSPRQNPEGKLVIFSESKVTAQYLFEQLQKRSEYKDKILNICAGNRAVEFKTIRENFDASYRGEQQDDYQLIISTEVLAEGVNLHRANCVLNYDIPWNSTKLMQRIGRVNRIGSRAEEIFIYAFYPSEQGDEQIDLKNKAHIKLQSFHYLFGNDSQVLSTKEKLIAVVLHNPQSETEDEKLKYLQIIRDLRHDNRPLFNEISRLSIRSRSVRAREHHDISTAVFLRANEKCEFFVCKPNSEKISSVDFVEFAKILECEPTTPLIPQLPDFHYDDVNRTLIEFQKVEVKQEQQNNEKINDPKIKQLLKDLRDAKNDTNRNDVDKITALIKKGAYSDLAKKVDKAIESNDFNGEIRKLAKKYNAPEIPVDETEVISEIVKPQIILSESFV